MPKIKGHTIFLDVLDGEKNRCKGLEILYKLQNLCVS